MVPVRERRIEPRAIGVRGRRPRKRNPHYRNADDNRSEA
jgi:hypothetical protein